jgi:hypothetical protein
LHCEKNNFENIFFVENSPVQPLVGAELCANTSSWDKGKGDGSKEEATGDGEEKLLVERPT